jgi:ferric-dicitrate binding protein FerR (iron transport regulator)
MKKFEQDKSFLARWAENKLTQEELSEFKSEEDFKLFDKINKEVSKFRVAKPNIDEDYLKVKNKLTTVKKGKLISFSRFYYAAASILLLMGLFWFANSFKTINAQFGEKTLAELPDGSKVHLNAGSEIKYKRFFWDSNRTINLKGEAYFEVLKGESNFIVNSKSGRVEVLGTKFNILDRKKRFEVVCYTGKVKVNNIGSQKDFILEKGDKVLFDKKQTILRKVLDVTPNWKNEISLFENESLQSVLESLERQYNINIEVNTVDISKYFTGSFVHNNLELALKTTLPVMGISYKISEDGKSIFLK